MTKRLPIAAALLATVALAGCGDGKASEAAASPSPSASASASPTRSAPPVDGGTYTSPLLIIDALAKAGIDCTGYSAIAQPRGALARGNCHVSGEEYTVGIYATAADARAQPDAMAELLKDVADVDLVLGQNWTVGCPTEADCRQVAAALGGEVFHAAA